jgi:hypothetical protein
VVLFLSSFAVLVYNISGMYVTEQVGAAARTVLENARTLLVWLVSVYARIQTDPGTSGKGKHCTSMQCLTLSNAPRV